VTVNENTAGAIVRPKFAQESHEKESK
jgi:hypothetical protein